MNRREFDWIYLGYVFIGGNMIKYHGHRDEVSEQLREAGLTESDIEQFWAPPSYLKELHAITEDLFK